jgi:hypothetical protein
VLVASSGLRRFTGVSGSSNDLQADVMNPLPRKSWLDFASPNRAMAALVSSLLFDTEARLFCLID